MKGAAKGPFSKEGCAANLPGAAVDPGRHLGKATGTPAENYWDGCMWQTQNVDVTGNLIRFDPQHIPGCTDAAWPACGANGVFAQYGGPNDNALGWEVPTQITFFQNNRWSGNVYAGPSRFYAWNQGNPVSWEAWTGPLDKGTRCLAPADQRSGTCSGPFGQDQGSRYVAAASG
jgi:hypothetical protein